MEGKGLEEAIINIALEITMNAINIEMPQCKFCQSKSVVKNGKRNGTQYYICRACGRGSTGTKALPRMRYPMDTVANGVYDYYAGHSLNDIRNGIRQECGLKPADSAIYGWVKKLTRIGLSEAKKHTPKVSNKWLADETVIKLKDGKKYWLIVVIDYHTRFVLTAKLSSTRNTKDMVNTFELAKKRAGGISPKVILTDGWRAYPEGIEQVFGADTKHIVTTPFERKEISTNIVERWNGTLKDRLKPMRGMDKSETHQLILEGFVFYYNFLRPHESLNGKTPAEAAKTSFPYKDWKGIIRSELPEPEPKPKTPMTLEEARNPYPPYRKWSKPKRKVNKRKARTISKPKLSTARLK